MLRIAHRGAKGYAAENSIGAFRKALELHSDGIEIDVHLNASGEVMVIHDETVDRTTNASGKVKELTSDDFRKIRIKNTVENVPTLTETIDFLTASCLLNIEIKSADATDGVIREIDLAVEEKGWSFDQFLISSFDWLVLKKIKETRPEIPIGVLTETDLPLAIEFAKVYGAHSIHPHFHLIDELSVSQMQSIGLKVFAWTANDPSDIKQLKDFGVDAIISDFPDRI